MQDAKTVDRRRHGAEFKERVLAECAKPGASVARVALAHGLNTNLVHKWRRESARGKTAPRSEPGALFVPLQMAAPSAAPVEDIRVELRKGAMMVTVSWPASSAQSCALWLRELLK